MDSTRTLWVAPVATTVIAATFACEEVTFPAGPAQFVAPTMATAHEIRPASTRVGASAFCFAAIATIVAPTTTANVKTVAEHQVAITFASSEAQPGRALSEIKKGRNDGMVSLEQTLARMIRSGRLALDTALSVSGDPQSLGELVRSNG